MLNKELKPKYILQVILFLRKNSIDDKYVTQKDIMESLPIERNQVSTSLKILWENKLINIKMINTIKNTGPRKKYKLNKKGLEIADQLLKKGLSHSETNLLDLNKKIHSLKNNNIHEEWLSIIQLFQEYGLNEKNSLFSEMIRNFVNTVINGYNYETQINHESIFEEI